jgi:hypothetical protein
VGRKAPFGRPLRRRCSRHGNPATTQLLRHEPPGAPARATHHERLALLARAVGNPTRLQIVRYLSQCRSHIANDIVEETGLAQSTISEHVRALRDIGIVVVVEDPPPHLVLRQSSGPGPTRQRPGPAAEALRTGGGTGLSPPRLSGTGTSRAGTSAHHPVNRSMGLRSLCERCGRVPVVASWCGGYRV